MTYKVPCPACNSATTETSAAFVNCDPCPSCHLDNDVWRRVIEVRSSAASAEVRRDYEAALVKIGMLEVENQRLTRALARVSVAIKEFMEETDAG